MPTSPTRFLPILLPPVLLLLGVPLAAQCSDAGACLAGRPGGAGNQVSLSLVAGASGTPDDLAFRSLRLDLSLLAGPSTRVVLALPFQRVAGPLGRTEGPGDAVLLVEQRVASGAWRVWVQAGARLATGDDRRDPDLPQAYQTGLGPADGILGVRAGAGVWEGGLAYQRAGGRNANPATRLRRGDDLLGWTARSFTWHRARVSVKATAIQRLQVSSVRGGAAGTEVDLPGSRRLQVNLGAEVSAPLARGLGWSCRAEFPLLSRPVNADGLKRAWTLAAGLAWTF